MKVLTLLLALSLAAPARLLSQEVAARMYTPEELREDATFLYETLQATHYDLYANTSRETFDAAFSALGASITAPLDFLGAYRLFQPFAALAKHAHCSIGFPFEQCYGPYVMGGGKLFPLDAAIVGGRLLVLHNYSDNPEVAPGDEILAIDGRSAAEVMGGIHRFFSGDSDYMVDTLVELILLPRVYWLVYGEQASFDLVLKRREGSEIALRLSAVPAATLEQQAAGKAPRQHPDRALRFAAGAAYLRPGMFLNKDAPLNTSDHRTFAKGEFLAFLDSAFVEIHKSKSSSLIVDLRGNPGGDNSFSDPMVAYFADKPFWFCSRFAVRTSQLTKDFWQGVEDPMLATLRAQILSGENGTHFETEIPSYAPRADSLRFAGKVYVLIDRFSYSNAVTTAAIIQDYGFGTLVGEPTADVATTYGAIHQFSLPNTKMSASYPKAFMVRPSGRAEPSNVVPEHRIEDDVFTEQDEVLDFTLSLISGDQSTGR